MSEENKKIKEKIKSSITKKNILIAVVIAFFAIQYIQIRGITGSFSFLEGRDSSLISEIGQIKEAYLQMGTDMNEVRDFLRLPTKNYLGFDNGDEEVEDEKKDEIEVALGKYADYLSSQTKKDEILNLNRNLLESLKSKSFSDFLEEQDLSISKFVDDENGVTASIDFENNPLVIFYLEKKNGSLLLKTPKEKKDINFKTTQEFEKFLIGFIKANKQDLLGHLVKLSRKKADVVEAISLDSVQNFLTKNKLQLSSDNFFESNFQIVYPVRNLTDETIGEIQLSSTTLEFSLVDKKNDEVVVKPTKISSALLPFLEKLDTRSIFEKKADESLQKLKSAIANENFQSALAAGGFIINSKPREDESRIYYDIYKGSVPISSLVVEKSTGVINIVKPDGTNSENLLYFEPQGDGGKKKTLDIPSNIPDYGDNLSSADKTFNILIAGKHGSLLDTMIFAHIDEVKKTVRMVSIPRDLFYNGRKINAFAHFYGMPELKKVISKLSGYKLDKYILVDMYAFIDVIDLIGGIDVSLKTSVIDPSYRTVDNGVEGTLHYEPGDYHLGGKEALRLARSRHTSSDFARAERQQMIISAIQNKAREFGFGDADTIYEIAKAVLKKTDTDITLDEALAYYFRYQNYTIESNDVMSSGNVLYVPPYITKENCEKLIAEAAASGKPKPGCENENQAYALLPRDDNWNVIKWFFKEKFEE